MQSLFALHFAHRQMLTGCASCRFKPSEGVIVVAATNFPESLDKALVRPGRFDRHVVVPNPDVEGRRQILESHFANVPRLPDVDLQVSSSSTSKHGMHDASMNGT